MAWLLLKGHEVHGPTEPVAAYVPYPHGTHTLLIREYPLGHLQSVMTDEFAREPESAGQGVGADEAAA